MIMNQFKRAQCILLNTQNDNFQFQLLEVLL